MNDYLPQDGQEAQEEYQEIIGWSETKFASQEEDECIFCYSPIEIGDRVRFALSTNLNQVAVAHDTCI